MGQKKNSKIILISIMALTIFIIIIGVAYIYFATDLFKSNQELFFKYFAQLEETEEGFFDKSLKEYWEKKNIMPYTNEGELRVDIEDNLLEDFNITFIGKTNKSSNYISQDISLNYGKEITFPVNFNKTENIIGLQTPYVGSKHIAVKMDEPGNETLNTFMWQIPSFSKEEKNRIKQTYLNAIKGNLQESQFTRHGRKQSKRL